MARPAHPRCTTSCPTPPAPPPTPPTSTSWPASPARSARSPPICAVNQVIDADIQRHFLPGRTRGTVVDERVAAIINKTLAGGIELNRQLDQLTRSFEQKKADLHLTPEATQRVVATALELSHQPGLVEIGDDRTDAPVFQVPHLSARWQKSLEGLATPLNPEHQRPITFDADALVDPEDGSTRTDIVAIHLGHPLLQRSARLLRNALMTGGDVNRVTAVTVPSLETSCVAAVSRLVLVGRGGLRLHEEVFVAGIRMRAQDLAEEKVLDLLDTALDPDHHQPAGPEARARLARLWNAEGSRLHERLTGAMQRRADSRQQRVEGLLKDRRDADLKRAREIFAAFRRNLTDSIARLRREDNEQQEMLPIADDQRAQRARDLRAMEARLDSLADEERRELDAIEARYTDVKPYVSAVALVFALAPGDDWEAAR